MASKALEFSHLFRPQRNCFGIRYGYHTVLDIWSDQSEPPHVTREIGAISLIEEFKNRLESKGIRQCC